MSRKKYCELVDQLCEKLGIENPASKYDDCHLEVDGIAFTLMHGDKADPDGLVIYTDFGKPPVERREQIYRRLLETSFVMYGHNTPSFAFNTETDHVIQMLRVPASSWLLAPIMTVMANLAEHAHLWRQRFFLDDTEQDDARASSTEQRSN